MGPFPNPSDLQFKKPCFQVSNQKKNAISLNPRLRLVAMKIGRMENGGEKIREILDGRLRFFLPGSTIFQPSKKKKKNGDKTERRSDLRKMAYLPHPFPQSKFTLTFFLFSFSFSFNGFFAPHVEPLFFFFFSFFLYLNLFLGSLLQSLHFFFFFFFSILFVGSFILCSLLWTILSFSFLYKIITWKSYAIGAWE